MTGRVIPRPSRPGRLLPLLLFAPAGLLFLPVFYYSLNTPFGLVDDYSIWKWVRIFDGWAEFYQWIDGQFLSLGYAAEAINPRHRPFYEFYNAVTWKILGPTPGLHHLGRWAVHFGGVLMFAAAYLCAAGGRRREGSGVAARIVELLPLTLALYLWLFFPNSPAAQLGPTETYTVFFLGLCLWMLARMLTGMRREPSRGWQWWSYGLFLIGYGGLAWSKESNPAALLGLLLAYYVLVGMAAAGRRREGGGNSSRLGAMGWPLLGGLPLLLILAHTLVKVYAIYAMGQYGVPAITPELVGQNFLWLLGELYQVETSLIITAGLALMSGLLAAAVGVKARRRERSGEFIFMLLLLGLFGSMLLMTAVTSWGQVLNYVYPLLPPFIMLLGFGVKFGLEVVRERRPLGLKGGAAAGALAGFALFFVAVNYYNFLYQTVIQQRSRSSDDRLLEEVAIRYYRGQQIVVEDGDIEVDRAHNLRKYFREFQPRFYGGEYYIATAAPGDGGAVYYRLAHTLEQWRPAMADEYLPLGVAYRVAYILQAGPPRRAKPWSEVLDWEIYSSDWGEFWNDGRRLHRPLAPAGEPLASASYEVYGREGYLIYRKEPCGTEELGRRFFVHLTPAAAADLVEREPRLSFNNLDHILTAHHFYRDGKCLALLPPPGYAVSRVRTGQFATGEGELWSVEFAMPEDHRGKEVPLRLRH